MKKQINEPDFIGGFGSPTKEEEIALSIYFAKKNNKITGKDLKSVPKKNTRQLVQV